MALQKGECRTGVASRVADAAGVHKQESARGLEKGDVRVPEKRHVGLVVAGDGCKRFRPPVQVVAVSMADEETVIAKVENGGLLALETIVVVPPNLVPGAGKPRGCGSTFQIVKAIAQEDSGIGGECLCPDQNRGKGRNGTMGIGKHQKLFAHEGKILPEYALLHKPLGKRVGMEPGFRNLMFPFPACPAGHLTLSPVSGYKTIYLRFM